MRAAAQEASHDAGLAQAERAIRQIGFADAAPAAKEPGPAASMRVTKGIFLGEVLFGTGMVTKEQLEQAMHLHYNEGILVGDALIRIGALTPEELERGLELHTRLRHVAGLSEK